MTLIQTLSQARPPNPRPHFNQVYGTHSLQAAVIPHVPHGQASAIVYVPRANVCRAGLEPQASRPQTGLLLTRVSLALDRRTAPMPSPLRPATARATSSAPASRAQVRTAALLTLNLLGLTLSLSLALALALTQTQTQTLTLTQSPSTYAL